MEANPGLIERLKAMPDFVNTSQLQILKDYHRVNHTDDKAGEINAACTD
jgi:hypothetical protein